MGKIACVSAKLERVPMLGHAYNMPGSIKAKLTINWKMAAQF